MKSFSEKLTKLVNDNSGLAEDFENAKDQAYGWISGMPLG